MLIKVITKKGVQLEEEVKDVSLPSVRGRMEVLKEHAGIVVLLSKGKVLYDGSFLRIEKGVARVFTDKMLVLAEGVKSHAVS